MNASNVHMEINLFPLLILCSIGFFFFVLKMPKDLGIYLGWLPTVAFILLSIFDKLLWLIPMFVLLAVYITATVLRIDKKKRLKAQQEKKMKEIDKMSINDL